MSKSRGSVSMLLLALSAGAYADEVYVCTYGKQERIVSVIYEDQESRLPCEVRYIKDGETEQLWRASYREGYCEAKAAALVEKLGEDGWRCGSSASPEGTTPQLMNQDPVVARQIDSFKQGAAFVQAIALTAPFKISVIEYYYENGRFPRQLEDIGMERSQMQDSSHISDMKLADEGTILVQGNDTLGLDTVIALRPRVTLGGRNIEWQCTTNLEVRTTVSCTLDPDLTFD